METSDKVVQKMSFTKARQAVRKLASRLRRLDGQLATLSSELPEPVAEFEAAAELRGIVECVRSDLLADAITTLEAASERDEIGLRMELVKRQLAAGGAS